MNNALIAEYCPANVNITLINATYCTGDKIKGKERL